MKKTELNPLIQRLLNLLIGDKNESEESESV